MTGATVHIVDDDGQVRGALAATAEHAGFLVRAHATALAQRRAERLSERERDVMRLITAGASNQEAASRLGISVRTVENHRARVMEKMGATTLSDLIRQALRLEDAAAVRWTAPAATGGELTPSPQ